MTDRRALRSHLLRWAGGAVVVFSLAFVASKLHASWSALADWQPSGALFLAVAGASVAYALMGFLLSTAWHLLVGCFDHGGLAARTNHRLYARSQIAKYIPGNVLQVAGRHALARREGSSHAGLVAAALYEIAGLLAAAGGVSLVGAAIVSVDRTRLTLVLVGAGAGAALITLLAVAARHPALRRRLALPERRPGEVIRSIGGALALYLVFFVAGGLVLVWLIVAVGGAPGARATGAVVAAFSLSWAAGFLTPGAPAGLGVREAALVATLGGLVDGPTVLLAALALRVVTIVGDSLYFAGSFLWRNRVADANDQSDHRPAAGPQ